MYLYFAHTHLTFHLVWNSKRKLTRKLSTSCTWVNVPKFKKIRQLSWTTTKHTYKRWGFLTSPQFMHICKHSHEDCLKWLSNGTVCSHCQVNIRGSIRPRKDQVAKNRKMNVGKLPHTSQIMATLWLHTLKFMCINHKDCGRKLCIKISFYKTISTFFS